MSADLLAAFGNAAIDDPASTSKLNDTTKLPSTFKSSSLKDEGADTWQPWPTSSQDGPNAQDLKNDTQLWADDKQGQNVLFDAAEFELDHGFGDQEDDFGEFEDADVGTTSAMNMSKKDLPRSMTSDLLDLDFDDGTENPCNSHPPSSSTISAPAVILKTGRTSLENVDDDWGGFENAAKLVAKPDIPFINRGTSSQSDTHRLHCSSEKSAVKNAEVSSSAYEAQTQEIDDFGAWDDFEDAGMTAGQQDTKSSPARAVAQGSQGSNNLNSTPRERPTNIPPPAILLTLFPRVFFDLSKRATSSDPLEELGFQIVEAYKVCARIIAGRALRWKRDTILAQSMRIGAAGRSGGMKLSSLDKGESRKEEQEAEEAIASWSRCSHRLNAAMIKAKVQKPPMSLSITLVVKVIAGPDVLTASHICPICGLKRNERLNGIDVNVLDTFGDFWVEHWGHKDCYDFWYRNNSLLDRR